MKYATIPAILLALALPAGPALGDAHGGAAGHAMDNARIDALLRALDVVRLRGPRAAIGIGSAIRCRAPGATRSTW
jgi:hypothetical protein